MYRTIVFSLMALLLSGLAAAQVNGQTTVVSGYASAGVYSMPIVPLINTPSLTLGTTSLQVEAGDALDNNKANVTNTSYPAEDFDFGAALSQDSFGAAGLASLYHPGKAVKVYTNQDVAQVNDTNGLVKFGNKTEHL